MIPWSACLFHFSKSIYRKVQKLGIAKRYINDAELRNKIKMITALAFAPAQDTIPSFHALAAHSEDDKQPALDYFETTCVGDFHGGRRPQPSFPLELWKNVCV